MGPVKDFFAEKGLSMKDLPVALLSYEIVSIFWWTGCWSACYQLQPGRSIAGPLGRLMPLAQREKSAAVFQKALGLAEAQVAKATWISRLPIVKTAERPRLVVSLAESLVVRGTMKPISLVGKLWLSYNMVMLVKRVAGREEGKALVAEGEHTATAAELNEKGGEPTKKGRGGKQSQAPADRK